MKTVFTNAQCAHVWAQQNQSHGKSDNMFFRDASIFSYGTHFEAARIHTVKGIRVALINSHRYSSSTGRHLNHICDAVNGLMPHFTVSDVSDLKKSAKELTANAETYLESKFKTKKVDSKDSIKCVLENVTDAYAKANELRKLVGLKPVAAPKKRIAELKAHYAARFKRYQELNTPEMIAKRDSEKGKRDEAKVRAAVRKAAATIEKFRTGETNSLPWDMRLPTEVIRVRGDTVETSRGASVPLRDALTLFRAIERTKDVKGFTVGSFTVIGVTEMVNGDFQDDKIVQIGCHKILLSEARAVLGAISPNLKLVG